MKTFKFDKEGLQQALEYKDYIGMAKETIENNPELLPIALGIVIGLTTIIVSPMASAVAYKTSIYDSVIVAFKYLGGF
jgi:predicted nucleic acid-binding protein